MLDDLISIYMSQTIVAVIVAILLAVKVVV